MVLHNLLFRIAPLEILNFVFFFSSPHVVVVQVFHKNREALSSKCFAKPSPNHNLFSLKTQNMETTINSNC